MIVYENELHVISGGRGAKTSPLAECAGIFLYTAGKKILAHYKDMEIEPKIDIELASFSNWKAVLAGCGVPIECTIEDSTVYHRVREYLGSKCVSIEREEVGYDYPIVMAVSKGKANVRRAGKKEIEYGD